MPIPSDAPIVPPASQHTALRTTVCLKRLLEIGRTRGHITYDEFNELLPCMASTGDIADTMARFKAAGIDVIDPDGPSQDERDLAFADSMDRRIACGKRVPYLRPKGLTAMPLSRRAASITRAVTGV